MGKASSNDKDKIVGEFETMKTFELSAHDLYARIANDPSVTEPRIKTAFRGLAEDEKRHADLVQEIINTVNNAL